LISSTLANNIFKIMKMLTNTLRTLVKEPNIIKISLKLCNQHFKSVKKKTLFDIKFTIPPKKKFTFPKCT